MVGGGQIRHRGVGGWGRKYITRRGRRRKPTRGHQKCEEVLLTDTVNKTQGWGKNLLVLKTIFVELSVC